MAKRRSSKGIKSVGKKMKRSCMWGGEYAAANSSGLGATGYGTSIYGDSSHQTTNGMGGNLIKMADPSVVWKGGQSGGEEMAISVPSAITDDMGENLIKMPDGQRGGGEMAIAIPSGATDVKITWTDPAAPVVGGSMFGATLVPAALLAANQLYKPTRALKNLRLSRNNKFRKTMKKLAKRRR